MTSIKYGNLHVCYVFIELRVRWSIPFNDEYLLKTWDRLYEQQILTGDVPTLHFIVDTLFLAAKAALNVAISVGPYVRLWKTSLKKFSEVLKHYIIGSGKFIGV